MFLGNLILLHVLRHLSLPHLGMELIIDTSKCLLWWWWWWMMIMNCFCRMIDWWKGLSLFPSRTIVKDPHHRKSLTCCKQFLNLQLFSNLFDAKVIKTFTLLRSHFNEFSLYIYIYIYIYLISTSIFWVT